MADNRACVGLQEKTYQLLLYAGQFSEKLKGRQQADVVILGLVVGMQARALPVGWAKRRSEKSGGRS